MEVDAVRVGSKEVMEMLKKRGWMRDNNWRRMKIENASVKKIPATELHVLHGRLKKRQYGLPFDTQ